MELIVFFSSKHDWPVQQKCYFDYSFDFISFAELCEKI